ncbi:MAG: hypothetical protein ACRDT9_11315 [Agromyces sp.]
MTIPTDEPSFAGLRLHARASVRRLQRRTVAWPLVTVVVAAGATVGAAVAQRTDPAMGAMAGLAACAAAVVIWLVSRLAHGIWGRNRLAILSGRFGDAGAVVFAVRSTASFDRFPPTESSLRTDYSHPWRSYQLAVLGEAGLELRQMPRAGQSVGARLRYSSIEVIADGTATFSDFADRAILVRGREKGVLYEVGIVPVRRESLMLSPVDEDGFQRILSELVVRAQAADSSVGGSR